ERPGRRSLPGFLRVILANELIAFLQESRVIALAGLQFAARGRATARVRLDLIIRHRPVSMTCLATVSMRALAAADKQENGAGAAASRVAVASCLGRASLA